MSILKSVVTKAAQELVDKHVSMEQVGTMFVSFGTALLKLVKTPETEVVEICKKAYNAK